jgi:hypothetical protein
VRQGIRRQANACGAFRSAIDRFIYLHTHTIYLEEEGVGENEGVRDVRVQSQRIEQGPRQGDEDCVDRHGQALGPEADLWFVCMVLLLVVGGGWWVVGDGEW